MSCSSANVSVSAPGWLAHWLAGPWQSGPARFWIFFHSSRAPAPAPAWQPGSLDCWLTSEGRRLGLGSSSVGVSVATTTERHHRFLSNPISGRLRRCALQGASSSSHGHTLPCYHRPHPNNHTLQHEVLSTDSISAFCRIEPRSTSTSTSTSTSGIGRISHCHSPQPLVRLPATLPHYGTTSQTQGAPEFHDGTSTAPLAQRAPTAFQQTRWGPDSMSFLIRLPRL